MILGRSVISLILILLSAAYTVSPFITTVFLGDESVARDPVAEYVESRSTTSSNCFNYTLLSAVESEFALNLSQALTTYSAGHKSYTKRLSTFQYYFAEFQQRLTRRKICLADYFDDQRSWGLFFYPECYQTYNGDVLASLDPISSAFVFFPLKFSFIRFENSTHPSKVNPPPPISFLHSNL